MNNANRAAADSAMIVDLDEKGRGIAKVAGKAVFVSDALPGEHVELLRSRRHRNYDEAHLQKIIEPSPDRVTPACAHFGVCGGCALQHLSSVKQIEFKQRQMLEALARIGHVQPERILPPLQADAWNYRRRARLGVRWVAKKNRALVGFRERNSAFIADIERCAVLRAPLDQLIRPLSALIDSLQHPDRVPQIEVAVADNTTALVFRLLFVPSDADRETLRTFGREHDVQIYLQLGGYDSIAALDSAPVALSYRLPQFEVEIAFEPCDFVQVHGELNRAMVTLAVDLLEVTAEHRVLDLFCGLGNFSLPLARRAADVTGVEADAGLIARARANAQRNELHNTHFFAADLFADVVDHAWARQRYDRVLIDPPRAGAQQILPLVASCGAQRLVYISCHPASFARDAGILVQNHGFKLIAATVMDMFPHTAHVESIAVFEKT